MTKPSEIQPGALLVFEAELWKVLEARETAGRGDVVATLRCVRSGAHAERRIRVHDRVQLARTERRELQYLYAEGDLHHFMDTVSFEQTAISAALLDDSLQYMKENDTVTVETHEGVPVGVVLPGHVPLVVTATGPGTDEETVANVFKTAMLETGLTIRVPLYVETGETVEVDTRTGQFVGRVS